MRTVHRLVMPGYFRKRGAAWNPVTQIGWAAAYWAEGTEFAALAYGDTDNVTSWPDEIGTFDLSSGAGTPPTYVASWTNGRPAVKGNGTNAAIGAVGALGQPYTLVVIGNGSSGDMFGSVRATNGHFGYWDPSGNKWEINDAAGSFRVTGGADGSPHLLRFLFDGAGTPAIEEDGTALTQDIDTLGTNAVDQLTLFARANASFATSGHIAFVGAYSGDVTADGGWTQFKADAATHYGLTVA